MICLIGMMGGIGAAGSVHEGHGGTLRRCICILRAWRHAGNLMLLRLASRLTALIDCVRIVITQNLSSHTRIRIV